MAITLYRRHVLAWLGCSSRRCFSSSLSRSSSAALPPYNILFCGTDDFAKTCAKALYEAKDVCSSMSVLTPNRNPFEEGRLPDSSVRLWAKEMGLHHDKVPMSGINTYVPPPSFLKGDNAPIPRQNLLLTASFGELIPQSLMANFHPHQCLNLHPSLLPLFAGAAPIQWAIANQVDTTGVTVQTLGVKFDTGNIYAQEETPIPPMSTHKSLAQILAQQGSQLIIKVLRDLPKLAAGSWPPIANTKGIPLHRAPKLSRQVSKIRWDAWTAEEIEARGRAFGYMYPLSTKLVGSRRMLLREVEILHDLDSLSLPSPFINSEVPGTAIYCKKTKSVIVACRSAETYLSIKRLQAESKKVMDASDWIVGYRDRADKDGLLYFRLYTR